MKEQLLGIYISLMVHGAAAILLFGISQGMTPSVKTVALDFSIESGGPGGEGNPGKISGAGGGEALSKKESSSPEENPGDRRSEFPMKPESTLLAEISEPRPLMAGEPSPPEEPAPAMQEPPPVLEEPPPVIAKTTPVPLKKTVERVPVRKAEPKPPVQTVKKAAPSAPVNVRPEEKPRKLAPKPKPATLSESPRTLPPVGSLAGVDRPAESVKNGGMGLNQGPSEPAGSGTGGKQARQESGGWGIPRGDGGNAYLRSHFNFIRGRLREYLCYPRIAQKRGWAGKVMVSFTIHPDGRADNIEIQKSSGISLLDKSALKTVQNASPFPKPPIAARIVIPILYELN